MTRRPSQRVMHLLRTCKDCFGAYQYSETHTNPRYCPGCVPHHPRKCTTCKASFHPMTDTDRLCPIHVVHEPLFGSKEHGHEPAIQPR